MRQQGDSQPYGGSLTLDCLAIGHNGRIVAGPITTELRAGSLVCLVGRNGSGKSTLLRTLAGLTPPVSGSTGIGAAQAAIVLTSLPALRNTRVSELVAYGRLPYTGMFGRLRPGDLGAARRAIMQAGIAHLADRFTHQLSDGERQKAMIAMALAQERPVLLLDEPSAFLDYPSRHDLMRLLQRLAHEERKTVLLTTHDIDIARHYVDQVWHLHDGALDILPPDKLDVNIFKGVKKKL